MKRLTPAFLTLIMFGVVAVLVTAYVAKGLFAREAPKPEIARKNLPTPVTDIEPGTVLTERHLGLAPVNISELKADMLVSNRVIIGRVVKEKLFAAQPIRAKQLYEPDGRPSLVLEPGMRAVTVNVVGSSDLVSGLIKPAQFCDMHMTFADSSGDARFRGGLTMTLFKGVRILAINGQTRQGAVNRDQNEVTFELTTAQSNILLLAKQRGVLTLSYNPEGKGDGGIAVANQDRVMLDEILGLAPITEPAPPEPFRAQIYRGSGRQLMEFRDNNVISDAQGDVVPSTPAPRLPDNELRTPDAAPQAPVARPEPSV